MKQTWRKIILPAASVLLAPCVTLAQGPPKPSSLSNPLAITLLFIIIALLIIIGLLANVVIGAAKMYLSRYQQDQKQSVSNTVKLGVLLLFVFIGSSAMAQEAATVTDAAAVVEKGIGGMSTLTFYTLLSVIGLEVIILFVLLYNLKLLLQKEALALGKVTEEKAVIEGAWVKVWDKLNSFRPLKDEREIDLGHNYDGIGELDNKLPPWWLYGFYCTIIFASVYLWQYHVSKTAPLPAQELQASFDKAEVEKEAYLKKAANNIDENSVKLLTDVSDLEAGKKVFTTTCAACHLADGGGSVGPNLTDEYWLHGGGIKNVFKTLKYGWPEKGMKSWKDDYSPKQLAQIASYVVSLKGTKPAKAKEPQGTIYTDTDGAEAPAPDSTKPKSENATAGK